MLIELYGENFGSFRNEFCLSMEATDIDANSPRGVVEVRVEGDPQPLRLLRSAAIYGANASGKSTVLRAASALQYVIENSATFRSDYPLGPYEPFMLDARMQSRPVILGVRGVVDSRVYDYRISFMGREVVEETLAQVARNGDLPMFHREKQKVSGPWTNHTQFKLLIESFRPNALLLSLADSLAPSLAGGIATGLTRLLRHYDSSHPRGQWLFEADPVAERVEADEAFAEWLRPRVRDADIGVVNYETEEAPNRRRLRSDEQEDDSSSRKSYRLKLLHDGADGPTPIPFIRESRGTKQFLSLMPVFFDLAHSSHPQAHFIDEIDASLHPVLLEKLVQHFNCELPESKINGQLIFATHTSDLVDDEAGKGILRRDQVWFTEKDAWGASRLYSLAEFKVRNNLNIRRRYRQGRYGALPSLGDFAEK